MSGKWKVLGMLFVSLFLVLGLVACGGSDEGASTDNGSGGSTDNESEGGSDSGSGGDESTGSQEEVEIRFSWWGDTARNDMYNEIVDRFEAKYPHIKVQREFGGWADYWDRLATQIAGGNAPDVVSMHQFYVSDYAGRGALVKLDEMVDSGELDLSDFPDSAIDSGRLGGDLYMVAKGITMPGMAFNTASFDALGVDYPDFDWTWDDFVAKALELREAIDDDSVWGLGDFGGGQLQPTFRYYARQHGGDLFTEDGQLDFDEEILTKWWTMWDDLRQANAIPDAATLNEFDGAPLEGNMFVTGRTLITQIPANQIYLYQQQFNEGEIQMVRMPHVEGGPTGEYIEGAYLSISERSNHHKEAAMFIDFFVNEKEALELFKVEQGPPAGVKASEFVMDLIDPAQARAVEFIQATVPKGRPAPYAPLGINEVQQAFDDNAEAIAYGQKTVEQAVQDFFAQARSILE